MPRLLLLLLCVLLLGERAQEAAALTDVAAREPDRTVPPVALCSTARRRGRR